MHDNTKSIREKYIPKVYEPSDTPFSLLDLTHSSCRWPIGEPRKPGFHFCGKQVKENEVYCEEHYNIAYRIEDSKYKFRVRRETPNYDYPYTGSQIAEAAEYSYSPNRG